MNVKSAFLAGVIGAAIMTIVIQLARIAGLGGNISLWLGSAVTGELGASGWLTGFFIHLTIGGLFGIGYAFIFEVGGEADAGTGAKLGIAHAMLSGLALGALPWINPLMPEALEPPGMFMANFGLLGVLEFIGVHIMYGSLVGHLYDRQPITRGRDDQRSRGYMITETRYEV